ncbi:MAG: phage tail tape measure protein [Cohaesibacter sp.]|jgi:phage-related minor tail protein|nr:phage tail tape measure protein [Cohaesibacter sp.]
MDTTIESLAVEISADMRKFTKDLDLAKGQADQLGRHFSKAIEGALSGTKSLESIFRQLAVSMSKSLFQAGIAPLQKGLSGALSQATSGLVSSLLPFAKGGVFAGGSVTPFANGGIVSAPTAFPMRSGIGLMGEAGPEAIMPLKRGADGRLGVQGAQNAGATVSVVMNITTPDAASFAKSENQIAIKLARAVGRGRHGL